MNEKLREILENLPQKTVTGTATGSNNTTEKELGRMIKQEKQVIDIDKLISQIKALVIESLGEEKLRDIIVFHTVIVLTTISKPLQGLRF